ncbi:MAG: MdtA/MuxA family multidrug efflux RND transporter periplasmic adaptor subunit [Methylophilaceae bacterium]|nr:MdtA/MuxA family multidrug efflux RND transporter periplasmic adaptor subunit [Methylophilaceae bacterium]
MAVQPATTNTNANPEDGLVQREPKNKSWVKKFLIVLAIGLLVFFGFRYYSNHAKPQDAKAAESTKRDPNRRPATVSAVAAKKSDISVYLNAIGTVTPRSNVVIRTRIDGQLMRVLFNEGQYVKQGDLLAEIDPRPYQVQLAQAQGQLAKDQALLKNAQLDLERYKTLLDQDSAPEQQVATQNSVVSQYKGTIQTDQSQIDNARLQLTYARITAPISGRVGLRQVDAGNIVHQSDANGILSISEVKPITVVFSTPQDNLAAVLAPLRKGVKLPVEVYGRDQKNKLAQGFLQSADNQIDTTTGTVKLKAQFANEDESLFPNQFVNVRVLLGVNKDVTVIPNAAIQRGSQGTFVYQVQGDQRVTVKPIKVIVTEGEFSSVEGGVSVGDLLVTSGADKLREGAKVQLGKENAGGGDSRAGKRRGGRSDARGEGHPQAGAGNDRQKRSAGQ